MSKEKQIEIKVVTYKEERLNYFTALYEKAKNKFDRLFKKHKDAPYLSDEFQKMSDAGHEAEFLGDVVKMLNQSEGEWQIKSEIYQMLDDVDEELFVECPFCQRRFWVPYEFDDEKIFKYAREHYPYCNCGAKMKGGE